jgi:hypothetical protein
MSTRGKSPEKEGSEWSVGTAGSRDTGGADGRGVSITAARGGGEVTGMGARTAGRGGSGAGRADAGGSITG